jgi:hypothetical protein
MRQQDDLAASVGDFRDGGRRALKPRAIADFPAIHRDIEIDPEQHALASRIRFIECAKGGHGEIRFR